MRVSRVVGHDFRYLCRSVLAEIRRNLRVGRYWRFGAERVWRKKQRAGGFLGVF